MIYIGYVLIPHDTYFMWKNNVLNNGYDADGYWGAQCWDLTAEFWYNVGFPTNYPLTGGEDAKGCWIQRYNNISYNGETHFDLIENKELIQEGDIIVFNPYGSWYSEAGHIAFADENYNGTDFIRCLGQNQQSGTPVTSGGKTTSLDTQNLAGFAGAFRYRKWHTPTPEKSRGSFPWYLIAKKLRNQRI